MTAEQLDEMVKEMRRHNNIIRSRIDLENIVYGLYKGCKAIGLDAHSDMFWNLYEEIDSIHTEDIMKIGIFSNK